MAGQAVCVPQLRYNHHSYCFQSSLLKKLNCNPTNFTPSISVKNRKNSILPCRCSSSDGIGSVGGGSGGGNANTSSVCKNSSSDWDWSKWSRHFSEIEQAESFSSLLKFQLEDAIEKEDFTEAVNLKKAISEATSKDSVAEIMSQLKDAIDEERYHDASRLCKCSGSGLVGWWVGWSKDSNDPFGRLVRISPGVGRFVGRSYTPRQLVNASPGTPLFEIFVVKEAEKTYSMQVVYLQRPRGSLTNSITSPLKPIKLSSTLETEKENVVDIQEREPKVEKEEKGINIEEATEEGIKSVINFLKEKIPGLKVKVMNIDVSEVSDDNDPVKQFMQDDDEKTDSDENSDDEGEPEEVAIGAETDKIEEENNLDMKLFIGGVLHNKDDAAPVKEEYVRLPAEITDVEKDSFVLHVPASQLEIDIKESKLSNSKAKVAALAAQSVSELMPADVAKAFRNFDKVSAKVSKDVQEIVKLAVSQAQKRNRLAEHTNFSRITTPNTNLDPFEGLYVGAFGPYGTEVVQLRRKFGHWSRTDDTDQPTNVEFFEYVEAVKLTGDLNVPAGEVTFRAKIGKGSRSSNRGLYPDELGVVASYKGQGRIADFGFRKPQWVDGELLQLGGKGMGPYVRGADLGFLYIVPEQSFLVLFNRLRLPE